MRGPQRFAVGDEEEAIQHAFAQIVGDDVEQALLNAVLRQHIPSDGGEAPTDLQD